MCRFIVFFIGLFTIYAVELLYWLLCYEWYYYLMKVKMHHGICPVKPVPQPKSDFVFPTALWPLQRLPRPWPILL